MGESPRENFFSTNHWVLRCAGIMSPNNAGRTSNFIFLIHSRIALGIMVFYMVIECMAFTDAFNDMHYFSISVTLITANAMGMIKVSFVLRNNKKFKRIMAKLDGGEFRYEKCQEKGFDPELVIKSYRQFGRVLSRTYLIGGLFISTSGLVLPLIDGMVFLRKGNDTHSNFTQPKLPFPMWFPLEPTTWGKYCLGVTFQNFPMFCNCFGFMGVDMFCANIMNCVAMNLTLIQKAYLTVRERCAKKVPHSCGLRDSPELSRVLKLEMKKICQHLQSIYKLCDELEDMSTFPFFIQISGSMVCICTTLYAFLNLPLGDRRMIRECGFLSVMFVQLFLYCWFGNEVTCKAEDIPSSIWESEWISMDTSLKKDMILTMARTNTPLVFTGGKFIPLTLDTYVQTVKASYSFYAFMKSF